MESATPSLICPGRAVVSVTPAAPSVVSMTPEVLPLASPPPATAPTLSRSSSPLVSPPPEPVVQRVRIKKKKSNGKNPGTGKKNKRRQDSTHKSRHIQEVERDGRRSGKGRRQSKAKRYKLCQEVPDVDRGGGSGGE